MTDRWNFLGEFLLFSPGLLEILGTPRSRLFVFGVACRTEDVIIKVPEVEVTFLFV